MPKAEVTVNDEFVKKINTRERWREINRIVQNNPQQSQLMDLFFKKVTELRRLCASEAYANRQLERVKARQSELGQELSMLNMERLAIMAYLETQR